MARVKTDRLSIALGRICRQTSNGRESREIRAIKFSRGSKSLALGSDPWVWIINGPKGNPPTMRDCEHVRVASSMSVHLLTASRRVA